MKRRNSQPDLYRLLIISLCVALAACAKPTQRATTDSPAPSPEASKIATSGSEQPKPEASADKQAPMLAEAQAALTRVYQQVVVVGGKPQDTFVTGDFNGDGSEDIAIVVSPAAGKLAEINSEFANWILVDPRKVSGFDPKKAAQALPPASGPVQVEASDTLLAVIHGFGPAGWRDLKATQSYLLKNAAGEGLRAIPLKNFPPALKVKKRGANSRADIISETLAGKAGFLYWTAGKYAWQEQ